MRVGFVCHEYPPGPHGGIGTMTQLLARELVQAGHQVRVVGVYPRTYPAPGAELDQGVVVQRLRASQQRLGWLVDRYRLMRVVTHWAARGAVDLVELADWEGWAAGWPGLPIPVVVRLHGSASYFAAELGQPVRRTTYWLERASLQRADFWCAVSGYTAEVSRARFRLPTSASAVLHNAVQTAVPAQQRPRDPHTVVFAGTLTAKKGVVSLVRAWTLIHAAYPSAQLHLFGKDTTTELGGSMQTYLHHLAGTARASVHFHGHVARDTLLGALRHARVAVYPSYAEAFAIAPLEAMACGCPTISSCRGSGPEQLHHGQHGLLVDPDSPSAIAQAIVQILSDDALAQRLGQAGQQHVRSQFASEVVCQDNERFYHQCISEFAARARGAM